jgi:3-methyladenine DNA glycosylase/8-oxoguanine DNA glycosylase
MNKPALHIATPPEFSYLRTIYSHGWVLLPPFSLDKETQKLTTVLSFGGEKQIPVTISDAKKSLLVKIHLSSDKAHRHYENVKAAVASIFRLDESMQEFYREASRLPEFRWVKKMGAGRLLRSQTVFEDIVKMICTTNCSWALTQIMVDNLVKKLGKPAGGVHAFPSPGAIAACSEKFLRSEIRCGYRAPYLLELAGNIAAGKLTVEHWRTVSSPTEDLFEEMRSVKGIGPYAAGNLLKLAGRYEHHGLDSWCRQKFYEIYKKGRKVGDAVIEKHYQPFGKWRGLFFWLDVTKEWHSKKFPFEE